MKGSVIYSRSTGVEFRLDSVEKERKRENGNAIVERQGVVRVRAFEMEGEKRQVKVILSPWEAHLLSRKLRELLSMKETGRINVLIHRVETPVGETVSRIVLERWVRGNRDGYSILISRDDVTVNVPLSEDLCFYLSDFLRHLSMEASTYERIIRED